MECSGLGGHRRGAASSSWEGWWSACQSVPDVRRYLKMRNM